MKGLKGFFLCFIIVITSSCNGGGGGGGRSSSDSKSLWSKWTVTNGTLYMNFTNGDFDTNQDFYLYLPLTQVWLDALNTQGRDTTGLVAGTYYLCGFAVYLIGDENSGSFATNHDDIDEPAHNACLEWDSNCTIGSCNFAADHTYTKSGDSLTIDYFGAADGGLYGVDSYQ